MTGLVPGFRIQENGTSVEEVLFGELERAFVVVEGLFPFVHHPECGKHAGPEHELGEEGVDVESIGPGDEMHLSVVNGQQDAQCVIQAELVVGNDEDRIAILRDMVGVNAIELPVVQSIDDVPEVAFDQSVGECSFLFFHSVCL